MPVQNFWKQTAGLLTGKQIMVHGSTDRAVYSIINCVLSSVGEYLACAPLVGADVHRNGVEIGTATVSLV